MKTLANITINLSFESGVHSVARLQKNHPIYSLFVLSLNFNDFINLKIKLNLSVKEHQTSQHQNQPLLKTR